MGKRQRTDGGPDSDYIMETSCMDMTADSSVADEVEIVWGSSPPAWDLKLCSTPGPQTRRRSDLNSKEIAEMMDCLQNRSQEIVSSTPPLLGLWMQGRKEGNLTPLSAHRPSSAQARSVRKTSKKLSPEDFMALTNELKKVSAPVTSDEIQNESSSLNMQQEQINSKQSPSSIFLSPLVVPQNNPVTDSLTKDCPGTDSLIKTDSLVTDKRRDSNLQDSSVNALWDDDSWYENDSFIMIATQLEAEALSQVPHPKQEKAMSPPKPQRTVVPQTQQNELKSFPSNQFKVPKNLTNNKDVSIPERAAIETKIGVLKAEQNQNKCDVEPQPAKRKTSIGYSKSNFSMQVRAKSDAPFVKKDQAGDVKDGHLSSHLIKAELHSVVKPTQPFFSNARKTLTSNSSEFKSDPLKPGHNVLCANQARSSKFCSGFKPNHRLPQQVQTTINETEESSPSAPKLVKKSVDQFSNISTTMSGEDGFSDSDLFSDSSMADEELLAIVEKEEEDWKELCSQQIKRNQSSPPKNASTILKTNLLNNKHHNLGGPTLPQSYPKSRFSFKFPERDRNKGSSDLENSKGNSVFPAGMQTNTGTSKGHQFSFGSKSSVTEPHPQYGQNKKPDVQGMSGPLKAFSQNSQFTNTNPDLVRSNQLNQEQSFSHVSKSSVTTNTSCPKNSSAILSSTMLSSASSQFLTQSGHSQVKNLSGSLQSTPSPVFAANTVKGHQIKTTNRPQPQLGKSITYSKTNPSSDSVNTTVLPPQSLTKETIHSNASSPSHVIANSSKSGPSIQRTKGYNPVTTQSLKVSCTSSTLESHSRKQDAINSNPYSSYEFKPIIPKQHPVKTGSSSVVSSISAAGSNPRPTAPSTGRPSQSLSSVKSQELSQTHSTCLISNQQNSQWSRSSQFTSQQSSSKPNPGASNHLKTFQMSSGNSQFNKASQFSKEEIKRTVSSAVSACNSKQFSINGSQFCTPSQQNLVTVKDKSHLSQFSQVRKSADTTSSRGCIKGSFISKPDAHDASTSLDMRPEVKIESSSQEMARRTCSQEEIERKRQEALARRKKNSGKHHMSLRRRPPDYTT